MALRIVKDAKGIWQINGSFKGVRVRKSTGTADKSLAEIQRAAEESAILDGTYGKRHPAFELAVDGYLDDGGSARFMLKVFTAFDGWELRKITPNIIRREAEKAYPDASNATRNRQFITPASAVINWAHQQGWCSPIKVRRFPVEKAERRAVDREWLDAFMSEASPHLGALYLFMFTTGARVSEACKLEWSDVDLKTQTALLRDTKNGTDHTAHLSDEMCAALKGLPLGPRVFGYRSRHSVYGPAQTACSRAGIEYVPPHQAGRHSFATALDSAGMTASQIATAGNWRSVRLVQETYTHPEEAGRKAAQIMEKKRT